MRKRANMKLKMRDVEPRGATYSEDREGVSIVPRYRDGAGK